MSQFLQKDKRHRILLWFTGMLVILLGILTFVVPPGVDPDSCWGFLVMHNMEQGSHFNLLVTPDPANLAKNQSEFLAWWSPGQYLVPYFFKTFLQINTGRAVAITITLCYLIGLAGFYQLFKKLGFTKWVSAVSIAFIATQQFFILQFVYYIGGELLLFAFLGWFLYGCFSFTKIDWRTLLFVFGSGLIGFFSKSSVLWMYTAGVICLWINVSSIQPVTGANVSANTNSGGLSRFSQKRIGIWLRNGAALIVPFFCALAAIYFLYLNKGSNPTSTSGQFLLRPETLGFPLASPFAAGFSVDELLDGLIYQPDGVGITYHTALFILLGLATCSLVYAAVIYRRAPGKKYAIVFLVFYAMSVLFFSYMYLKQSAISYEARHFRIIGLLLIPGIVYLAFKTRISAVIFFLIWIGFMYLGFGFFTREYRENRQTSGSTSGLNQQIYDRATMNTLTALDRGHHQDAVFVTTSPDIAMEIVHNRVLVIATDEMSAETLSRLKYAGNGGALFILLPAGYKQDGRAEAIVHSFVAYHHFSVTQLSAGYYLYSATY